MLDRSSPLPLHFQLRTALLQEIESRALNPGDAVPTEVELMNRFGVSRITVRQAVSGLINDGILYRQHGIGTFVRRSRIQQELATLTGFSEEMITRGLTPSTRLISAEIVVPDQEVASRLQIGPGGDVLRMVRVRLADGEPTAIDISQCPGNLGRRLLHENLERPLYELMERALGIELDWAEQAIEATLADDFMSRHLGIKRNLPILMMERVAYSVSGEPVEHSKTCYRADRYSYRVRLNRHPRATSR
ncbi:MAG TPA: GntR family transcriptional regulator [Chloroflexota bacterium]